MKTIASIAAELQGYDPQALRASAVSDFLSRLVEPVAAQETTTIFDALGRVLAEDVISPISVPPHDNSAMDGYAFDGRQLESPAAAGKTLVLRVLGTALAGKAWQGTVGAGECLKIMTGAILPHGLDTVVPQEFVTAHAAGISFPADLLQIGANRRRLGEDLMQGQPALRKGDLVTPAALGLLASLGIGQVPVLRRLRGRR